MDTVNSVLPKPKQHQMERVVGHNLFNLQLIAIQDRWQQIQEFVLIVLLTKELNKQLKGQYAKPILVHYLKRFC